MRHGVPTSLPPRSDDPTRSALTEADCLELALLALPQERWNEYEGKKNLDAFGAGEVAPDPRVQDFFDKVTRRRQEAARG